MSREIDKRDFSVSLVTSERSAGLTAAAAAASNSLPGPHRVHIAGFDNATGNASGLVSTSAPAETGNFVARALQHLQTVGSALGLAPAQPNEFAPDPQTQTTSSGAVVVHLQQSYKSIPIFQADQAVTFTPLGAIDQTNGTTVTIPSDVAATPTIAVGAAAKIAAQFLALPQPEDAGQKDSFGQPVPAVAIDSSSWQPRVIAAFGAKADAPSVLEAGPFGDVIKALLVWFFSTEPRLAWHFVFVMPAYQGQYRVIVDAQNGEILYSHQLVRGVTAVGNVFQRDGSTARTQTSFPRPAMDYGLPAVSLPGGFPADWVSGNNTNGNAVNAHLNDTGAPLTGAVVSSVLTFDPSDPGSDDQRVLNIFYYSCYMHDYLYLLGFREADGNFQQNSLGPGGTPGDPLDARAYEGAVWATASMATPVDGTSPIMRMGLVTETSRHTALDSTVVFHEYTHGLTGRLVGGPMNDQALDGAQSAGMSEGWSDYVACTITGANVIAAWVLDTAAGARGFPYDSHFPDTFGNLGTGRYDEPHNIGEIWCAALLAVNDAIGSQLALQLMVDGLKLTAANPGFLDGRDSMLLALDHMRTAGQISAAQHDSFAASMWQVFARFGMGPNAQSNGASLSGIVGDFDVPQNIAPASPPASAFTRIGSPATGLPASVAVTAVTAESQRLDAFAVVSGGPIYTSSRTAAGGAWVPWTPAGGASSPSPPLSGVTAVSTSAGRIDLFLVAGDGEIQTTFRATSGSRVVELVAHRSCDRSRAGDIRADRCLICAGQERCVPGWERRRRLHCIARDRLRPVERLVEGWRRVRRRARSLRSYGCIRRTGADRSVRGSDGRRRVHLVEDREHQRMGRLVECRISASSGSAEIDGHACVVSSGAGGPLCGGERWGHLHDLAGRWRRSLGRLVAGRGGWRQGAAENGDCRRLGVRRPHRRLSGGRRRRRIHDLPPEWRRVVVRLVSRGHDRRHGALAFGHQRRVGAARCNRARPDRERRQRLRGVTTLSRCA